MSNDIQATVKQICARHDNDATRLMNILREVQTELRYVPGEAMDAISQAVSIPRVEVESAVTFYAFFSTEPKGKIVIRLCDDIVDRMQGYSRISRAFQDALGVGLGETTADGLITLETAPCIGMCDQAPAAMINDTIFTRLSTDTAYKIVERLQHGEAPQDLVDHIGDGHNADELVRAMVDNNIRKRGPVVFHDLAPGEALQKATAMTPAEVIRDINTARLRGRGGAGFPAGMKWGFARQAQGEQRYVICNADEGEPGTFKDRAILTECIDLMLEGMAIAGYAIGSDQGILYLRGEYAYLLKFIEKRLEERRAANLLGANVCGKQGFNFDIRVQMGAGAYICGEETALISSCEGRRGDPKNRPPFPAQKGYLDKPSIVNNVETFCCVARVLEKGPGWFAQMGTEGSAGTKVLSVSGDCKSPGVYEIEFGLTIKELLKMVGAENAQAVQIGGPSGQLIGPEEYERTVCYDDLATGGSIVVVGPDRDLLEVVSYYMDFFIEEVCGYCTPCRVGNVLLKEGLERVRAGKADSTIIDYLVEMGETVSTASRCGLGQTSPRPVLTSIKNFRALYDQKVKAEDKFQPDFDLDAEMTQASAIAGRKSSHA